MESAKKGGALITAEIANGYNRDVFAVPGRPGDKYSEGCNNMINRNQGRIGYKRAGLNGANGLDRGQRSEI